MKHLKKYISLICALCLIFGLLSGCGSSETENTETYDASKEMVNLNSGTVAENENFTLEWNKERAAVVITSKKDGAVWSSTPVDYLNATTNADIAKNEELTSLMTISCKNSSGQIFKYYSSSGCLTNERFSSEKIDNGIRVTFYFDNVEVIAPMDIYLEGDVFKIKIDPTSLKSYSEEILIGVTPAPYLCSVKNTPAEDKSSYVAIPSGSGALLYTDQRTDSSVRTYSADFYGSDKTIYEEQENYKTTPLTMPFAGVKNGNTALCAIVESGAGASGIETKLGDVSVGYSKLAAYYNVVAYEQVVSKSVRRFQYNDGVEEGMEALVIAYHPLTGNNANYTGMANEYKDYLKEKGKLTKSQDNALLNVKLIGSTLEDDLFLGFPTTKAVSLTSYAEAEEILGELNSISGGSLVANMYAYGKAGLDAQALNGDNTLTGITGNKKALKNFVDFTNKLSIKTFFDFDSVTFAKSSNGFSVKSDSVRNVVGLSATLNRYDKVLTTKLSKSDGGIVKVMVSRSLLKESALDAAKVTDKYGITGVAYSTLGNYAYSDYNTDGKENEKYYPLRKNIEDDVWNIISEVKTENSKSVLVDGAYSYAAAAADIITSCPSASDRQQVFDLDIPLYQIVFQGTKANSNNSINTAINQRGQFLKAIETGSGLSFTLIANYNNELRKQYMLGLNNCLYSDNKAKIEAYVKESSAYLASVAGASIKAHQYLTDKVTLTQFDNGVSVVVNHGDEDYVSEAYGKIKAQSFITK